MAQGHCWSLIRKDSSLHDSMAASGRAAAGLGPHLQRVGGPRAAIPAPFVGPRTIAQRQEDNDRQGQDLAVDGAAGWEYPARWPGCCWLSRAGNFPLLV